ncbi:MAG: ABC transporter ATP-binding protein [Treponema sp.]|nr:MAG: ABC transporter ATP-binding protein [Treponema sp.]
MEDINTGNSKTKKLDFKLWKVILKEFGYFKFHLTLAVLFSGITGLFELVGPKLSEYAINNFITNKNLTNLTPTIIITAILIVLAGLATFFFILFAGYVQTYGADRLRKKCFSKLQELPVSYYDKKAVGWLMARMSSDINKLTSTISWGLSDAFFGLFMIISIIFVMFSSSPKLAVIIVLTLPVISLIIILLHPKILKAQRKVRKINSELTASYNEGIQGSRTTKTLVREELNAKEFFEKTAMMKSRSIKAIAFSAILMPATQIIGAVGQGLVLLYGGSELIAGAVNVGILVAFFRYAMQFNNPLATAADVFGDMISAQASAERIFELLNEKSDIKVLDEVITQYGTSLNPTSKTCPKITGNVEFKNVNFEYKKNEPILKNFNLKVKAGETIALVGATGSGKTTVANIFCRFYEPTSGQVIIDGIDYQQMPERWVHENLGYVLQSPHLFSGTIMQNIKYGNLNATDEEIINAAKLVNAHEFITNLPNGYNTQVGEGGGMLSTGQKQLVSFARAIIRNPHLFVLDEATSSVDTETEHKIQNSIEVLLKGRTSFVIAHRLSTIRNANKILLIENGEIAESGTHTELMEKKQKYYNLYMKQFIEEEQESII